MRFHHGSAAILAALFLCLTFHPADVAAQSGESRRVAVAVEDSSKGVIDGAVVVMSRGAVGRRAVTGGDGVARFNDLAEGEWVVEVRKEGFAIAAETLTVGESSTTLTITLALPTLSETVSVEARAGALGTTVTSASRLELSVKELPATLSVVTQDVMQERGANTAMDAIDVAGGTLTSSGLGGQLPGYQTRGFSGNSIMNDGIRQNSGVQSSRPQDSFTMDRVEVLKGPASLLAGEGGTAGTVNYVSKSPKSTLGLDSLLSYGSFDAWRVGLGVTGPLSKTVMARIDASQSGGGGWTKPSHTDLRTVTSSVWWTPDRRLTVKTHAKHTADDIQAYYSTPFIDGEPDRRMRYINYNMADAFSRANNNFARVEESLMLDSGWQFRNSTFAATQRLDYRNMEGYRYNPATGLVDVSTYFQIWRHDLLLGNQFDARRTVDIAGRSVTFIAGGELQQNKMQRARAPQSASNVRFSVDPFNPQPFFDPKLPYSRNPDVHVTNKTFYAEALARLSSRWTSVLGLRSEQIGVDYALVAEGPLSERRTFTPTTGRAGLVFAVTNDVNLYGSYSTSIEPATQFVSLSGCCGTATFFDLTPGRQLEVGAKGTWLAGRLEGTAAWFDIEKKNLPIRTLIDDVPTDQLVGRQNSRGLEFGTTVRPTATFNIAADLTYTDAFYSEFNEVIGGVNVSRDGNAPTGIPVVIWSITPTQTVGPVSAGLSIRQIGKRWADTANTLRRPTYQNVDLWASLRLFRGTRLTLRGRNLTDDLRLAGAGATSGRLAAPRSFEVSFSSSL
jgi:iron complex outermembrane receptor protein